MSSKMSWFISCAGIILLIAPTVDGGFSSWSNFGLCSTSCRPAGNQIRTRTCTNPPSEVGGKDCVGDRTESRRCNIDLCPVDGNFSSWSNFGVCSKTCGSGTQSRTRTCTNSLPMFGGKNCVGDRIESRSCNTRPCAVNGNFSSWSNFGACSPNCKSGIQSRTRSCTNPPPQYGGKDCTFIGHSIESRNCSIDQCPVDGNFSSWSNFGACSKTCGPGIQSRTRSCTNPRPQFGGKECVGDILESRNCSFGKYPVFSLKCWSCNVTDVKGKCTIETCPDGDYNCFHLDIDSVSENNTRKLYLMAGCKMANKCNKQTFCNPVNQTIYTAYGAVLSSCDALKAKCCKDSDLCNGPTTTTAKTPANGSSSVFDLYSVMAFTLAALFLVVV